MTSVMVTTETDEPEIDTIDRRIIAATQSGLAFNSRPYAAVADSLGLSSDIVIQRMEKMLVSGVIRRVGIVPNHYALGYRANGMSVWDVPDKDIHELGVKIGKLDFVSHCYHRPRSLPKWPYNLFAMVHAQNRAEVNAKVNYIAEILGNNNRGNTILFSKRILKKTGLRIAI